MSEQTQPAPVAKKYVPRPEGINLEFHLPAVATGMADNETFNVNGDTAAGAIAGALKADRLLLLTDVSGVKNAAGEVMTQITPDEIRAVMGGNALRVLRAARAAGTKVEFFTLVRGEDQ